MEFIKQTYIIHSFITFEGRIEKKKKKKKKKTSRQLSRVVIFLLRVENSPMIRIMDFCVSDS